MCHNTAKAHILQMMQLCVSMLFLFSWEWVMSVLVINGVFDTHSATCICHKHTAATAFVGMLSEIWSHLLTQTCFYLTDLEWLPLNSATATILVPPTDPNCANHWRQTLVFSLFLKKPPDSWVIKNIVPCCVLSWCHCGVGAGLDSLFGSLKGGCQD